MRFKIEGKIYTSALGKIHKSIEPMENTIEIHSFSKYGAREVNLSLFDKLYNEGKLYAITSKHEGRTHWFFKPYVSILGQLFKEGRISEEDYIKLSNK